jgi:hypothetical protein
MDPNANLEELRRLAQSIVDGCEADADDCIRVAELVLALDGWLNAGGFLPKAWAR